MMRTILTGAGLSALVLSVGCGSSTGDGNPQQLPDPPAPGRPAPNPNDPVANANQPATNPDRPGGPVTTGSGTGTTGGSGGGQGAGGKGGDEPPGGGKGCGDGCSGLQACAASCTSFCAAFGQMDPGNCASQVAAVKACVDRAGIMCDGTKIAIVGGACATEGNAYLDCLSPPTPGM